MENLILKDDETLILQQNEATIILDNRNHPIRLLLTDKNIYIQFRPLWKTKEARVIQIPLESVTVFNGVPEVHVKSVLGIEYHLIITTKSQEYEIVFAEFGKSGVQKWADYINKILVGNLQAITFSGGSASVKEYTVSDDTWQVFRFEHNETLLLKCKKIVVYLEGDKSRGKTADLFLTDKNLFIQFYPGIFDSNTKVMEIPLESITIIEGSPQIRMYSVLGIEHHIGIKTKNCEFDFWMSEMKIVNVQRWVHTINSILMNDTETVDDSIAENSEVEISYDVELDAIDNIEPADIENQSEGVEEKKRGFFADAFTDTKNKEYKTSGYVIKFETAKFRNSWNAYDNQGNCIYKIKRAMVAMRPCLKIYDNRKKLYVAEIKKHVNPMLHYGDEFVWVVQGETIGIVTQEFTGKLLDKNYNADFLGWSYTARPTKVSEIMHYSTVTAQARAHLSFTLFTLLHLLI